MLARKLGAASYGVYGVIVSQLLWLEIVVSAGIPGATAKLIADGHHDAGQVERSARALLMGLAILFFGLCWLLAPHVAGLMRIPDGAALFRLAALDVPLTAIYASYEGILYGRRRFGALAVAVAALGLLRVAGAVTLIAFGFTVARMLGVIVLSTLIVSIGLALSCRFKGLRAEPAVVRELATTASPMAIYLILSQVLVNLDLWSLKSLWQGAGEVIGEYVASVNLARTLTLIPSVQGGVLFASVAWATAAADRHRVQRHIQEAIRFALIVATGAFVIIGANGSSILTLLFSAVYANGDRFLGLLLAGFGLYALLDVFCCALMAAGRPWVVAKTLLALVPAVWLGNVLLIPWLGPIGAATSMVCGLALGATITGVLAHRCFGRTFRSSTLLRVLAAGVVTATVSAAIDLRGSAVLTKVAMLSVVYLLVLSVLRELTWKDLGLGATNSSPRAA